MPLLADEQQAHACTCHSSPVKGEEVRLPTLICAHFTWLTRLEVRLSICVSPRGITGAQLVRQRPLGSSSPIGPGQLATADGTVVRLEAGHVTELSLDVARAILAAGAVVVDTRGRLYRYRSHFERSVMARLAAECARQDYRMQWGLPAVATHTYLDSREAALYLVPREGETEAWGKYQSEIAKEEQFARFWKKHPDETPRFAET